MSVIKIIGKLNPKQYSEMLDHLTRKKIKNPFIKAEDIVVNKKPEVEEREAINAFMRRNRYGDGGITEGKGRYRGTFYLRIPNEDGVRINHSGTKFQMEQLLKKYKERLKANKIPSNKLTTGQKKTVLKWGKNKSKALGETWSDKKTLKEYDNSSMDTRQKIRSGDITGKGGKLIGEGEIKPLTKEQQKLWDATMADEFGKWEDYPEADRNRWRIDFPRKQKIYSQTKDLLNIDELAEYLSKEFNTDISRTKIKGRFGSEGRTALGQYINDNLFVDTFGSIRGNIEGEVRGNVSYYKKPTKTQINQIKKQNLVFDTRSNTLKPKTIENIKTLHKLYGESYRSGEIPKLQDMMNATDLTQSQIARAEARLAQIYNGHKFRNGPENIRVNKNTANKLFNFMSKSQFGNPRKNELYNISLDIIDEGLGNEKNTFKDLKAKARKILKENGIKVYSVQSPVGFNIDELAGVTGSAKSKNMAVSQFINIMEGGLNQTTLQNFQSTLSRARSAIEAAKDTPRYDLVLKKEMEKINTRAATLEERFGVKLARLERPENINKLTSNEIKRLKNIPLGTGESLYERLVKDAKISGYSIKFPKGTPTIQEFVQDKKINQKIIETFKQNLKNKKFGRVADVVIKTANDNGFGDVIQKKCVLQKKAKGGRIFLKDGPGCPAAREDPKSFLKSVSDNPEFAKFLKSGPGQRAASLAARVTGNVLNPSTLIGGEVAFVLGDGLNNFASGLPLDESFDRAFIFADFGKFEKNLMNKAKELGYDDNQLNLLQQTINLNKLDNRKKKLEYGLEVGKQDPSALTSDATMGFENRLVNTNKNLDDSIINYFNTLNKMGFDINKAADQDTGFRYLDNVFKKRTQDQLIKDFEDRKRQVDPTQTPFGDFISPVFDLGSYTQPLKFAADIFNPFTKGVPFLSERQREAKKLREMSEEELDAYNKARGFTIEDIQQGTSPQIRPLMDYLGTDVTGQGFGTQFLAGGGIAKIAGVDSGPPPEKGPMSQGLLSLKNRVRNL